MVDGSIGWDVIVDGFDYLWKFLGVYLLKRVRIDIILIVIIYWMWILY